jgi:hypothetical protein
MFGLSFGAKKSSQTTTSNVDKTETQNQTQSGTQAQTGTTTNAGTTSSQQSGTTAGQTTNQQATTGQQQTEQKSTSFSAPVLSALEQSTQALLGSIPGAPSKLDTGFNPTDFISKGVEAAKSEVTDQLDTSLNSIFDTVGGRDNQNSMATLLATKARSQAGASLAGTQANLEAQANQIQRENFQANLSGEQTHNQILDAVLGALKGGSTSTTGATTTAENTAASGTTAQQQAQTGTQATQNTQVQDLMTAINQILAGTTHTVGSETDKTKGSSMGGGFSIGI